MGECTGELPELDDVLAGTAQQVLRAFEELRESPQKIVQYCRDRDWLAGRTVLWSGMESDCPALARGMTEEGKLILRISGESVDRQIGTGSLTVLSETDRPESRMEY